MPAILQKHLPYTPWREAKTRNLPGIQPVKQGEWLIVDEAYAGQMAYRDELLVRARDTVLRSAPESLTAQEELLALVLSEIGHGYRKEGRLVTRPDGVVVDVGADIPIVAAARLVQEDLLILQQGDTEAELTAAVLCFPASWSLDEKFLRGLVGIHDTVERYDGNIAKRVQRMFDAIRPEQPLWRANFLTYVDPDLHQPRIVGQSRQIPAQGTGYVRVERQTLRKLAKTGAVVFGIHTYVVPLESLSAEARQDLAAFSGAD